ncbi:MAG: hypothetical protein K0S28_999 [Paucimonas sp.]|jgi:uncharacterized membrane protein YkvA (DUF1232 family)|nr:hypothetical protein [Paucimonas sp.]
MMKSLKTWARQIKRDAVMLWFARSHADTPFIAKAVCIIAVAYALSPIDLIPDFVPVLGYLDDVVLLPCFIWLAVRLLPPQVVSECRAQAEEWMERRDRRPVSYVGAAAIVLLWVALLILGWKWWFQT